MIMTYYMLCYLEEEKCPSDHKALKALRDGSSKKVYFYNFSNAIIAVFKTIEFIYALKNSPILNLFLGNSECVPSNGVSLTSKHMFKH